METIYVKPKRCIGRCVAGTTRPVKTNHTKTRSERGFSLLEVLITVAILGTLVLLAAPVAGKLIRRSQMVAGYSSMRQALAAARLQAVKRGVNVVVLIDKAFLNAPGDPPDPARYRLRVHTFQDRVDKETALTSTEQGQVGNFQQDANEPTLGEVVLPSSLVIWKQGGTEHDDGAGIAFDKYAGNTALTDRVAFLPTGGIAPPEDTATSGLPNSSDGRGIYVADPMGRNFFRVTVDSDISGRLRVDKYQAGSGYQASGWTWY
jgi:prepilin-type N-terminal cleavage/methylation domain-containing protein